MACGKGGTVSIPGVYGGYLDRVTLKMGQTHVHRYLPKLLEMIENGSIDPSFVISHVLPLDDAPAAYRMFLDKAARLHEGRAQTVAGAHSRRLRLPSSSVCVTDRERDRRAHDRPTLASRVMSSSSS